MAAPGFSQDQIRRAAILVDSKRAVEDEDGRVFRIPGSAGATFVVTSLTHPVNGAVALLGRFYTCPCQAGQHGRGCYHMLAAALLADGSPDYIAHEARAHPDDPDDAWRPHRRAWHRP